MAERTVQVLKEKCRGCGACVTQCPERAFSLDTDCETNKKLVNIEAARCTGCGKCIPYCRYGALIFRGE
ncbi:4Fe-4S binding protein [Seleniivibrio woodruffii]|uniref:4Fe-4S binding protein n=1 Tax=Seleniivibrio woodruffii TaxID=1078050 RepID=UPI0039E26555